VAQLVELVRGTWLEGLDEDVGREIESLCDVMADRVTDAVLSLAMFEQVSNRPPRALDKDAWERDRAAERFREDELAAQDPREFTAPDYGEWRMKISEQARRDVVQAKWSAGELPQEYEHRLPFLHARTFLTSLAQLSRALQAVAKLDTGAAKDEIVAARDAFDDALPALKPVRDSVEHAEDRMRGLDKHKKKLTLAPITNSAIHAPGGGVLVGDMLNGRHFGGTVEDGTYAEAEVSDATLEVARVAVQRVYDALPWRTHGYPRYIPSR
jgi:hypothetical protein